MVAGPRCLPTSRGVRLLAAGRERSTVARHLAAIKGFFRYLLVEGFIEDDPAASMRTPRQPRALPRVLGTEQVARLRGF